MHLLATLDWLLNKADLHELDSLPYRAHLYLFTWVINKHKKVMGSVIESNEVNSMNLNGEINRGGGSQKFKESELSGLQKSTSPRFLPFISFL